MDNYIQVIEQALNGACMKGLFNLKDAELVSQSWNTLISKYRTLEREVDLYNSIEKEN